MDGASSGLTVMCLVRHGETDWNRSGRRQGREDLSLNETGLHQARLTGAYLRQWPWDAIVTSPLSRALQTATIIREMTGVEVCEPVAELVERDYGASSGMTAEQASERWPDGNIPGLESHAELRDRASSVLEALAARFAEKRLLVVAHGSLINAMLFVVSGGELGSGRTSLSNACLCHLSRLDDRWRVDEYNSVVHLAEPAAEAPEAH